MSDPIPVTDSLRGFSQLIYTETAAAIQQMMLIDELPSVLELQTVRVCCGSKNANKTADGYVVPEDTPWLTELWFGKNMKGTDNSNTFHSPNPALAQLPCIALQGAGIKWEMILSDHGIRTIGQLSACSHQKVIQLKTAAANNKIIELVAKARDVTAPPPPIQRTALDEMIVTDAVFKTADEAAELEPADWNRILEFLFKLHAALDDTVLKSMTLREILG